MDNNEAQAGPATDTALTDLMAKLPELVGADPNDAAAMAPHVERLQELIRLATANPNDFYYEVVIIGKDGKRPYIHGTVPPVLLSLVGLKFTHPLEKLAMLDMRSEGLSADDVFDIIATAERPEFAPKTGPAAAYLAGEFSDDGGEGGNLVIGLGDEEIPASLEAAIRSGNGFNIGGDVAGEQPTAEPDDDKAF